MFLEAVVLGLLIGWLRGGRTKSLGFYEFRGWVLIVLGFLLQMLPMLFGRMSWMQKNGHILAFLTMLIIAFIVFLNFNRKGFWIISLGAIFNCIAMGFHGFKMPIVLDALQKNGRLELAQSIKTGAVLNYVGLDTLTNWTDYLGKIIVMPKFYPVAQALSLGDILISVGMIIFIVYQMNTNLYGNHKGRMVQITYSPKT